MSVVIVADGAPGERHPRPSPELLRAMRRAIEEYRLVATRLDVTGPRYVPVEVLANLALRPNAVAGQVRTAVERALERFFKILPDSPADVVWPLGRDVYVSELYALLERLPGVDYVAELLLETKDDSRAMRNKRGELVGIDLRDNELPAYSVRELRTTGARPVLRSRGMDATTAD